MLKVIIVDDEQPSIHKLEKLLEGSGLAKVTGSFTNPLDAIDFIERNKVDAVFLDIQMPDMDGIELASHISDLKGSVSIVFVTAYNQYAVEAFRLNAIDYLLKPVTAERLLESLVRITEQRPLPEYVKDIEISCFGKFCIRAGTDIIRFRTGKSEELLAYLIDSGGGFISRSKIIDSLWEDFDGDKAMVNFNTTLYYVKKALISNGIPITILYDRGSYRLDAEAVDCDYHKFLALVKSNMAIGKCNIVKCEEAAALYQGEYLSGWSYAWAEVKRLLLVEQFIELLIRIAGYYKDEGDYKKSIMWLKEGLLHEPLHRELNYCLIEALILTHERVLAGRHYDIYRTDLEKSLGIEPDLDFKKLLL